MTLHLSQSSSGSATAILGLRRAPGRGAVRRRHTNPTTEHRDAVRRSEVQLEVQLEAYALPIQGYHLDPSTGACGAVVTPVQPFVQHSTSSFADLRKVLLPPSSPPARLLHLPVVYPASSGGGSSIVG